jgi:hypothetical protein
MSFASRKLVVCRSSTETSVVAALDTMQYLLKGKRIRRLLLRFALIHLVWFIDSHKAVTATDRIQGKVTRNAGQRDSSVAIGMYFRTSN